MNRDPGKPPPSSKAKVDSLMKVVESLDTMWNIQDALCDEALLEGTKEGDERAQLHYNECMKLNAKRSEIRSQIDKLRETEAERKDKFGKYGGRGRKTRRRQKGKGITLSKSASDVCEGVGCPTRARRQQREAERVAAEALQKARTACWIQTGIYPPTDWKVGDPCPRPPPSPEQLAEMELDRQRAREAQARSDRSAPIRPVDTMGRRLPTGRRRGGKTKRYEKK